MTRFYRFALAAALAAVLSLAGVLPVAGAADGATAPQGGAVRAVAAAAGDSAVPGRRVYTQYGYVQVEAVVANGKLSDVRVREYPNHSGTSRRINGIALPYLIQEAVDAQSADIDAISGATITSEAFARSLNSALSGVSR